MNKIDELNRTKRYIRLSTDILQIVINNKNLSRKASSVWLAIYSKSFHSHDKLAHISHKEIASITGISSRSVSRAINELKSNLYLYSHIPHPDYPNLNIYECSVPPEYAIEVEQLCDRGSPIYPLMPVDNFENPVTIMADSVTEETSTLDNLSSTHDKTVYHIYNNINNNLQCTDCDSSKSGNDQKKSPNLIFCNSLPNNSLEEKKEELESRMEIYSERFRSIEMIFLTNPSYDTLQQRKRAESEIFGLRQEISKIDNEIEESQNTIKKKEELEGIQRQLWNDKYLINNLPGNRIVPGGLIWWITKKLNSIGILIKDIPRFLNEIVYSIRFGSLVFYKYTINEMPLMRAINVALKLIKEKRWRDPINYENLNKVVKSGG